MPSSSTGQSSIRIARNTIPIPPTPRLREWTSPEPLPPLRALWTAWTADFSRIRCRMRSSGQTHSTCASTYTSSVITAPCSSSGDPSTCGPQCVRLSQGACFCGLPCLRITHSSCGICWDRCEKCQILFPHPALPCLQQTAGCDKKIWAMIMRYPQPSMIQIQSYDEHDVGVIAT